MSIFIQDEEAVVDIERAGKMMLQDILVMSEPERTHYLKAWIDYGQYDENGGQVKLRTPDRKNMRVPHGGRGKYMTFPYQGKEVSRMVALQLLREFGENGFYHGIDMATGMSEDAWTALQHTSPEVAAQYKNRTLEFNTNYLIQVPYGESAEETDEDETE